MCIFGIYHFLSIGTENDGLMSLTLTVSYLETQVPTVRYQQRRAQLLPCSSPRLVVALGFVHKLGPHLSNKASSTSAVLVPVEHVTAALPVLE